MPPALHLTGASCGWVGQRRRRHEAGCNSFHSSGVNGGQDYGYEPSFGVTGVFKRNESFSSQYDGHIPYESATSLRVSIYVRPTKSNLNYAALRLSA